MRGRCQANVHARRSPVQGRDEQRLFWTPWPDVGPAPIFPGGLRIRRFPLLRSLESTEFIVSKDSPSEKQIRHRQRASFSRMFVESLLLVGSILIALAVDEWSEDREFQDLANRSLSNFAREINQNRVRLEDVTLFHVGLRDVLANMNADSAAIPATTIRNIMDGFQPAILVNTAWETAVATGALGYMDYDVVAGLSLTYSLQERLVAMNQSGLNDLLVAGFRNVDTDLLVYSANRYMRELTEAEQRLEGVYDLVLGLIAETTGEHPDTAGVVAPP